MTSRWSDDKEEDVIPESILSVAKDARYLQQCQDILQQFFAALFERKESLVSSVVYGLERKLELQRVRKQIAWLLSHILYTMISTTTGRTLGMEALGLDFTTGNKVSTKSPAYKIITNTRLRYFLPVWLSLLLTAAGGLVSDYFSCDNSWESAHQEGNKNRQQAQERTRGTERRLIHEQLRRQMLQRAMDSDDVHNTQACNTSNQKLRPDTKKNSVSGIFRRSMRPRLSERFLSIIRFLAKFFFKIHSKSGGPHNLAQQSNRDDNENIDNFGGETALAIILWIFRLHFAHFLLNGRYPTLIHRLLGLVPRRERTMNKANNYANSIITIFARPNTSRIVSVLILLQASFFLVQNTSNWFSEKVAKYLEAIASSQRRILYQNSKAQFTQAKLREKLNNIFTIQKSKLAQRQRDVAKLAVDSSLGSKSEDRDKKTTIQCTICRLERDHPACPSSCGHVCCWDCLMQWVSTVRPECPICRAPCSATNVLPLYNYEPIP